MQIDNWVKEAEAKTLIVYLRKHPNLLEAELLVPHREKLLNFAKHEHYISRVDCAAMKEIVFSCLGIEPVDDPESLRTIPFDDVTSIEISGNEFVVTGVFEIGRQYIEDYIEEMGGEIKSSSSSRVSYVIVGSIPDPAWKYGKYGTKVRSAIDLKQAGHNIKIVSEANFVSALNLTKPGEQSMNDGFERIADAANASNSDKSENRESNKKKDELKLLVPNFENGFAAGWFFAVPEVFKDGRYLKFRQGDVLYDSPKAYQQSQHWANALRSIKYAIQVDRTTAATEAVAPECETNREVPVQEILMQSGTVCFTVMIPNLQLCRLEKQFSLEADQENFITFLKTGVLQSKLNVTYDFRHGLPLVFNNK